MVHSCVFIVKLEFHPSVIQLQLNPFDIEYLVNPCLLAEFEFNALDL